MKLLSVILLLAFPILSLAQAVTIEFPPAGASIAQGEYFTVQIARPVRFFFQFDIFCPYSQTCALILL